jgi:hypothetical protein
VTGAEPGRPLRRLARRVAERHQGLVVSLVATGSVLALALGGVVGPDGSAGSQSAEPEVRGVTATSIKLVLYQPPEDDSVSRIVATFVAPEDDNAEAEATVRGFINVLSATSPGLRGRRIDLEVFTGSANLLDSVAARADAVKIAEDIRPYAVLDGPLLGTAFADELASRGVMCLLCVNGGTNKFYADHAPYVWSVQTTPEQVGTHVAEYVTKRLAGGRAVFAGDRSLQRTVRRFGLISVSGPFGGEGLGPSIADQLADAGVELADDMAYGDANGVGQVQATMIGRLKERGVTTVLYAGDPIAMGSLMAEATRQDWHPEWVMTGGFSSERSSWGRRYDQAQMAHAFGITPLAPPATSTDEDIIFRMYRDANGQEPPAHQSAQMLWAPVFLFFSGLGTGEDLSAEAFRRSLFADPIGGDPDIPYIPLMSYGDSSLWPYPDFAGIDDFAEIWWDTTATGLDEFGERGQGMWRYADGARRHVPGSWPAEPPHAFVDAGAVTVVAN